MKSKFGSAVRQRIDDAGRGLRIDARTLSVIGAGVFRRGGIAAVIAAAGTGSLAPVPVAPVDELDPVRYDFGRIDGGTISVLIAPGLDPSGHADHTALRQVLLTVLSLLAEDDDVREVGLALLSLSHRSVDGDAESRDRHLGSRSISQLRISGQSAYKRNTVHDLYLLSC